MIAGIIFILLFVACFFTFFILFEDLEKKTGSLPSAQSPKTNVIKSIVVLMVTFLALSGICMHNFSIDNIEQAHQEQTYNIEYFDIEYDSLYVIHNGVKDSTITFKIVEYDFD